MYFRSKNSRQERVWVKVWVKKAERENIFKKKKTLKLRYLVLI